MALFSNRTKRAYETEQATPIGWRFPESNDGTMSGADGASSASNFRSDPLRALGKENLQNPIDARFDYKKPVVVEFSLFMLPHKLFPGAEALKYAIDRSKEYSYTDNNSRVKEFFDRAEEMIQMDLIPILRISDFNTTGLIGSTADPKKRLEVKNSNWLHLVHGMGLTTKGDGGGGSHGKGKSAAIANSALYTIFYSTKDIDGLQAFQGVAYLTTHLNRNDDLTQGTGFYGYMEHNTPIRKCCSLDPSFVRNQPGTDVYIAGFNNQENWEERILITVLDEYLLAIYKGILEVKIGLTIINRKTLEDMIQRYVDIRQRLELNADDHYADSCWEAIKDPQIPAEAERIDVYGIDAEVQIFLKIGSGYPKKVDSIRQIGMRINSREYRGYAQLVGCMYISGKEINQYLAGLEDETHSKWEATRSADEKLATRRLKKLNGYLNDKIRQLVQQTEAEKIDPVGVEEYLPLEQEESNDTGNPTEQHKSSIASADIKKYMPTKTTEQYNISQYSGMPSEFGYEDEEEDEEDPLPKPPKPKPPHPYVPPKPPRPMPIPPKPGQKPTTQNSMPVILKKKILLVDRTTGKYILALLCDKSNQIYIAVELSGEDNDEMPVIVEATLKDTGEALQFSENKIGPIAINAGKVKKIEFSITEQVMCSLGVSIYAC